MRSLTESFSTNYSSYTVLIVESPAADEELYRRYLLADLTCRYTILEADSANTAVLICQRLQIDGILVDGELHTTPEWELFQELKTRLNACHPPIIVVASENDPAVVVRAIKSGAEDYLIKQTLTAEQLQLAMRSAIENAKLRMQLKQSNDRFRISIETMLDCFGIFSAIRDESGKIIDFQFDYLNAAALKSNEMTPADMSKTLCEIFPAHRETGLLDEYCRVVETGEPLVKENLVYSDTYGKQYLTRAFDIRASKLGDGFVISWRDVTASKQAEAALREANEQITTIWESMTDAYITLDHEWRLIYANSAAAQFFVQLTSLTPKAFLNKSYWELFPSLIGQPIEQAYRQALTEQVTVHLEVLYEPTGNWFEAHAYPSAKGLGIYFRDITNRKRTEQTVQHQLAEIEAIYKMAPIGLCFVDTELRFVRVNEQLAEIDGVSVCDHIGRTLREILPEMADQLEPLYQQVIESGEPILNLELQGRNYAQPGIERYWLVSYYPQKDMKQQVVGVNVVVQEITERKRNEEARKQAEAALRQSEQRFRAIFNTMFQFIGLLTPDGILIEANQTALDFGGLTYEDAIGRPFWEARWWTISPETQQQLKDAIAQARQGKFVRYEVEVLGVGDTTTIIDFSLKPVRDESGRVVLLIPEGRDISDRVYSEGTRKYDEQRLRESEERLQLGVQVAGVALARFDYASNTVTLSPEAAALYDIPLQELTVTRDRVHAAFHPDERTELAKVIRQVIDPAGSGWFAREHRVVWQNGEVRWLSVRKQVFFDRFGESARPEYAILAAIDITDRKQAEAALRQSEERYRYLAGLIPQLVWIADSAGTMLDVNDRWSAYTGLTLEQAQNQGWVAVVHPEDVPILRAAWSSAQQEETHYQAEGRMRRVDGVYRWYLHQAMPLKDEQGRIVKWFGTATDIDELKLIEADRVRLLAEAEAARAEAEAANRSKDDFVSLLAHELRSPLQAIMGWAKLLQTRQFNATAANKALDTIIRNAQSQVRLVEDLLDISRMVRGTLQLEFTSVNLVEVVEMAVETVRPTAEAKPLRLEMQLDRITQIRGDSSRLQQVVLNLLTNAIKFTPEGGLVQVVLRERNSQVQIQVSDTGKGISAEFLPHIFERFRQDEHNTTAKQGLGLGLALVKYIVEQHGGVVAVESEGEGQGATFTIMLPLLQDDQVEIEAFTSQSSSESSLSLRDVRVLVVDDDLDILNLTAFVLEQFDAMVQTATDAAGALEQLSQFQPDILISDIAMPEYNGYELLRLVRLIQPEGQIPAIALSAYSSKADREASFQAGFTYHLAKPVEPEELVKVILSVVQRRTG